MVAKPANLDSPDAMAVGHRIQDQVNGQLARSSPMSNKSNKRS